MIVYIDTSALVPLLIDEPTTPVCGEVWDAADKVICTRLGYIEATAALALAERLGRISGAEGREGRALLKRLWSETEVIELDEQLMASAAECAVRHGLRGYDATHCAAAIAINHAELVAASGDKRLLAAWQAEGITVRDVASLRDV